MSTLTNAAKNRILLVVERKLIRHRGHQHTQIAALKQLFRGFDCHLVAGEDYDGFLGQAAARISNRTRALSTLHWRMSNGSGRQKADAFLRALAAGRLRSLPASPYGNALLDACDRIGIGKSDVIVIPSADLESLESLGELVSAQKAKTPRMIVRFLDMELGEHKLARRLARLEKVLEIISEHGGLSLFCETEEMASEMKRCYGLNVRGGFYLPCSFDPSDPSARPGRKRKTTFRVGLFGGPRPGKGYDRVPRIVSSLEHLIGTRSLPLPIEILLQGSERDYGPGGVYEFARAYAAAEAPVRVAALSDRLSPEEFKDWFLSTDVILLPYDPQVYGLQGSGIIQDAVAAEKFVIHSKGIAMQTLLSHGNAIAAVSDAEFAEGVAEMARYPWKNREGCRLAAGFFKVLLDNNPALNAE
ncbi:hypothetical protein [Roseibium album]|uniref:Uncharacterized protein n=1 Tax=Roseibium album TaxID=311410 RepID=A0A0M6ZLK8_9HYPH|nr:hypothetical protein [Roseibium album]CTQ63111.1 hypothetical protein LA5094_05909 [Roseibium album]CTQ69263.1 hypothetical protein LA5096_02074 [Roseibium album]CTQ80607.1 hypothetical protein LA5095_05848 [Roseibium album]